MHRSGAEDVTEVSAGDGFFGAPRSRDGLGRGAAAGRAMGTARGVRGRPAELDPASAGRHRDHDTDWRSDETGLGTDLASRAEVVPADEASAAVSASQRRAGRRRWLGPSLIAGSMLCSIALITGVTQFANSACAAPPPAGVTRTGNATFYGGGAGNCSYPTLPADDLYVALGPTEYSASAACGGYLDVTGAKGSVRVKVVDQCPECAVGHLDLSRTAFAKIADPTAGDVPITYQAVHNPAVPAKLSVRVKEGSSANWLAVLIDNHGNPLTKVVVGSTALTRASYNYWLAEGGLGAGPFTIRVTDSQGRTATIPGIALSPGKVQQSAVALSGTAAPLAAAPSAKSVRPRASAGTVPRTNSTTAVSDAPPVAAVGAATGAAGGDDPASVANSAQTTVASPAASATGSIPANPDPSSSVAAQQQTKAPAVATGRNSCG